MTQRQLNREIARSTGESVEFIRNFGFSEICVPAPLLTGRGSRRAIKVRRARRLLKPPQQFLKAA
jgi:hypothetical protein